MPVRPSTGPVLRGWTGTTVGSPPVEHNVTPARALGERLARTPGLTLVAPVRLNVVCFTLAERATRERVQAPARAIAASGEAFVTPTVLDGTHALRAAFSNWRTTMADTERVLDTVVAATKTVTATAGP